MSPRVLAEAEAELLSATLYFEYRQAGLGQDFYLRVAQTIAEIGRRPHSFPMYEGKASLHGFRRARVERFPHIVVFQTRQDETLVVAIAHTSEEPGYWEARMPS